MFSVDFFVDNKELQIHWKFYIVFVHYFRRIEIRLFYCKEVGAEPPLWKFSGYATNLMAEERSHYDTQFQYLTSVWLSVNFPINANIVQVMIEIWCALVAVLSFAMKEMLAIQLILCFSHQHDEYKWIDLMGELEYSFDFVVPGDDKQTINEQQV